MPDYKHMTATEAMRHAKDVSGMTAEEIAVAMHVKASVIRRYLQYEDGYSPGLDKIPALCEAMDNFVLLHWIEAQLEPLRVDIPPAQNRAEVLTAAARIAASIGDVQRCLADSQAHGIDPACARNVRGLLQYVIDDCGYAQAILAEQASHADIREYTPLASLRPTPKPAPWWKFWRRGV